MLHGAVDTWKTKLQMLCVNRVDLHSTVVDRKSTLIFAQSTSVEYYVHVCYVQTTKISCFMGKVSSNHSLSQSQREMEREDVENVLIF